MLLLRFCVRQAGERESSGQDFLSYALAAAFIRRKVFAHLLVIAETRAIGKTPDLHGPAVRIQVLLVNLLRSDRELLIS